MKKWLIALLIFTISFTLLATLSNQESIIICSSAEQFRNDEMQRQLNQKFPQYNIIVMYMPTGKAAAKIFAEGENSEVDILAVLETGYLNKIHTSLEPIATLSEINYVNNLATNKNRNLWVTWERQAGSIVINPSILRKHNLPIPKTYNDLLNPQYKDLIAMPDPKSSGTGYFFYKNWINEWGDQQTLYFIDQLYKNLKQLTESGSGPIKLLKQGEIAIGLGLTYQAVNEINDGQPFEILMPELGSPYSLTGTAVIKNHLKKKGVREVYDFLINDFIKYDKEHFSPEQIYIGQKNNIPNYPQNIKYANMNGIQDIQEKERLLKLWKY